MARGIAEIRRAGVGEAVGLDLLAAVVGEAEQRIGRGAKTDKRGGIAVAGARPRRVGENPVAGGRGELRVVVRAVKFAADVVVRE